MMRVLHLTPTMGQGGAESHLLDLVRSFRGEFEQQIAIIHPAWLYPPFFLEEIKALAIPVTFLNKPVGKWGRIPLLVRYGQLIQRFQPDIVHAYQWDAMNLARLFHRFVPVQGLIVAGHNPIPDPNQLAREQKMVHSARSIVAISHAITAQYREEVPDSENRIVTIENGIDLNRFTPGDRQQARAALFSDLPHDTILAIMVARYASQKNQHGLAKAVKWLVDSEQWINNARIICLGSVLEQAYFDELVAYVQQHQLEPFIDLRLAVKNVLDYYHAADFMLLPSLYEGLPYVLVETAGCARPALVSAAADTANIFQEGISGWVCAQPDPESIANALLNALRTPSQVRDQMGQTARENVLTRFSLEQMAQQYRSLYQKLLKA